MSQKNLSHVNPANIRSREEFFEIIAFYNHIDDYSIISTLPSFLLDYYIDWEHIYNENHHIPNVSKQEIYNEAIKLYCLAIRHGDTVSKSYLAEQLLWKRNPYLYYDKPLGEFLMQIAMIEKCNRAYSYFAKKSYHSSNKSIYCYWHNQQLFHFEYNQLQNCLELYYDENSKKVLFKSG